MNDRLLDYIEQLESMLLHLGEELPSMREDVKHLLVYDEEDKVIPLLQIELENETSVPKVTYQGKEVRFNRETLFHWETKSDYSMGGLTYTIEHIENVGKQTPSVNRIERRYYDHI